MPPLTGSHNTPKRRAMSNVTPAPPTPTKPYKAVVAFVLAFLTALYATLQGRTDLDTMKVGDWLIVILGAVVTAGAVYVTTNPAKTS